MSFNNLSHFPKQIWSQHPQTRQRISSTTSHIRLPALNYSLVSIVDDRCGYGICMARRCTLQCTSAFAGGMHLGTCARSCKQAVSIIPSSAAITSKLGGAWVTICNTELVKCSLTKVSAMVCFWVSTASAQALLSSPFAWLQPWFPIMGARLYFRLQALRISSYPSGPELACFFLA